MDQQTKTYHRKGLGCAIAILAAVALLFFGRLALKSPLLFDIATKYAIEQAESTLNASVNIGRIRGDLLSGFAIHEFTLQESSGGDIVRIDSLALEYSLLSLIKSPHTIKKISVSDVELLIKQEADSSWNVLHMLPEPDEETEESGLQWHLEDLEITNAYARVESEYMLPDGLVEIRNLETRAAAGADGEGLFATVHNLQFNLAEQRLPEPVSFLFEGSMEQEHYTLQTLLVQTGRTLARGQFELHNESVDGNVHLDPLSRDDLAAYIDSLPLMQDMTLALTARGSSQHLNIHLRASANGLQNAEISADLSFAEEPAVTALDVHIAEANFPLITGIEESPVIGEINLTGAGNLAAENLQNGEWNTELAIRDIRYSSYQIDHISSGITFQDERLSSNWNIGSRGEEISIQLLADHLFENEAPGWQGHIAGTNLNLANWLGEDVPESNIGVEIAFNGKGISAEEFETRINGEIQGGHVNGQEFHSFAINSTANQHIFDGTVVAKIVEGQAELKMYAEKWLEEVPQYRFNMLLRELDMSAVSGFEEFPTHINGTFAGEGRGITPEQLHLNMRAKLDSSLVNGEAIDSFFVDLKVEDQFLRIDEATLHSPIADLGVTLNHHITNFLDIRNHADFTIQLKDAAPLAPLFELEEFQVAGWANGNLSVSGSNQLQLASEFEFSSIQADSLFLAEKIGGTVEGDIISEPEFRFLVDISNSMVSGQKIQDVKISGNSTFLEEETAGRIELLFSDGAESSLTHSGEFSITSGQSTLLTNMLNFETSARRLTLEKPFLVSVQEGVIQMDTLSIRNSGDEAYLRMWIPRLDSLHQQAELEAKNLNIGELQRSLTGESLANGLLSASISLTNTSDELSVLATGIVEQLNVESGDMDSLRFNANLAEEWLEADFSAWHQAQELVEINIRVPFLPGDPLTFDEQFFEREVQGKFMLHESDLTYWLSFLPEEIAEETAGRISLDAELGGIAGSPTLEGSLAIKQALLSGIQVDSLALALQYDHEASEATLNGGVVKDSRSILDFRAALPFSVDLKAGDVLLPSDEDSVLAEVNALDFNLAMFDNYLPPEMVQGLEGIVEGQVLVNGQISSLKTEGYLQLRNGRFRAVPAGINLEQMQGNINFEPGRISLNNFSVNSGPGRLQASGTVEMQGLAPGNMDIRLQANQFRLANIPELTAIANINARLSGTAEAPELTGDLAFLNTQVNLQNFGEQAVEQVTLEGEEEPDSISFFDRMKMEMNVNFGRDFFIRSRQYLDMEFVLGGEIDLVKEPEEDMQMFGTMEGTRGYARPLGKNFELDEAFVSFYGPINNPDLNIRTFFEPPQAAGVRIYYIIEGSLDEPEFRFDSDPQLELQDIISYTVFGKPFYELESWEQVVAGSGSSPSASDLAMDVLLDRVEMLASQRLGIDVVQIDNTRSGSGSTTSIKTGWYLNQKTFFAILNEVGGARPKTLFILEYLLRENLELIITQGDDSREGIDLRWKLDY